MNPDRIGPLPSMDRRIPRECSLDNQGVITAAEGHCRIKAIETKRLIEVKASQ